MPEAFPTAPVPSHVSSPEVVDKVLQFETDQGYTVRRAQRSRPRRRFALEYLGLHVWEVRRLRDFFQRHRMSTLDFTWAHPTALEAAQILATTPVQLVYEHGLITGQWVGVFNSPN